MGSDLDGHRLSPSHDVQVELTAPAENARMDPGPKGMRPDARRAGKRAGFRSSSHPCQRYQRVLWMDDAFWLLLNSRPHVKLYLGQFIVSASWLRTVREERC
jgi:hypothetical protein